MKLHPLWLLGVLACGGTNNPVDAPPDAPLASAFDGLWLMTSLTLRGDDGEITVRRDGVTDSLRGDAVFTATGDTTGTLEVRQALLRDGVFASELMVFSTPVTVEPDRWLLEEQDGELAVYTLALVGDHLELTLDAGDPRQTSTDSPTKIVVDRVPPWTTTAVGEWDLVTMELPDRTITAGACIDGGSGSWVKLQMPIAFSPRLVFERTMQLTSYSDDQCTVELETSASVQHGMVEHEGSTFQMWGVEDGRVEFQRFTFALAGDVATLTRTACLPFPACDTTAPLAVVVRRHP